MIEKPGKQNLPTILTGQEAVDYIIGWAKRMAIDLSKANEKETADLLNRLSTSISDDIVDMLYI